MFQITVDTMCLLLYYLYNTKELGMSKSSGRLLPGRLAETVYGGSGEEGRLLLDMIIEIDFNSEEALYIQLRNQIILGIAMNRFHEGDVLPSVRQLAEVIGINMHTVNKAYTVLKQEGYVKVDRRRGAVIAVDEGKMQAAQEIREELKVLLAKASCKNISLEEVHALIDEIYEDYGGLE